MSKSTRCPGCSALHDPVQMPTGDRLRGAIVLSREQAAAEPEDFKRGVALASLETRVAWMADEADGYCSECIHARSTARLNDRIGKRTA